jgi:prepilin-type N-terminal cleavage/methylation domain-containing protein
MTTRPSAQRRRLDRGFTLIELLIVIVILGILAAVTVFAVRGITDKGQTSACSTDKTTVQTATESYFAQYGGTAIPSAVVAAGAAFTGSPAVTALAKPTSATWTPNTEGANPATTLVNAGFLRSVSTSYWVAGDGKLYVLNVKCGTVGTSVG